MSYWVLQRSSDLGRFVGDAFKVKVPPAGDIDDLKKAIKVEMGTDYTGHPAQLTIYENSSGGKWVPITQQSTVPNMEHCPYGFALPTALPWVNLQSEEEMRGSLPSSALQSIKSLNVQVAHPPMTVPTETLDNYTLGPFPLPPTFGAEAQLPTEPHLQSWLKGLAAAIDTTKTTTVLEVHITPKDTMNLIDQKPDGLIYDKGHLNEESSIISVIELEAPEVSLELNQTRRQFFDYLDAIFKHQPLREFCFGLLTNGVNLVVYKAVRDRPQNATVYHRMWSGKYLDGQSFIPWLFARPLAEYGFVDPEVVLGGVKNKLRRCRGVGRHAVAFGLQDNAIDVVVKIFDDMSLAENERHICSLLAMVDGASHLHVNQPLNRLCVAIVPRGLPFDSTNPFTAHHAHNLIATLTELHKKGYVHGDIHPGNIYFLDASRALLTDWSHTRRCDDEVDRAIDFYRLADAINKLTNNVMIANIALAKSVEATNRKRERG